MAIFNQICDCNEKIGLFPSMREYGVIWKYKLSIHYSNHYSSIQSYLNEQLSHDNYWKSQTSNRFKKRYERPNFTMIISPDE